MDLEAQKKTHIYFYPSKSIRIHLFSLMDLLQTIPNKHPKIAHLYTFGIDSSSGFPTGTSMTSSEINS